MSEVVLGQTPEVWQERDAVHVAVIPMIAAETLRPGQRVGVLRAGVAGPTGPFCGVVDPFLSQDVAKGGRFYLCLYPNTVQGMRHHWLHPGFPSTTKEESAAWLQRYCATASCPPYGVIMAALEAAANGRFSADDGEVGWTIDEDRFFFRGETAHCLIPAEFWVHAQNVLGKPLRHRPPTFSCAC